MPTSDNRRVLKVEAEGTGRNPEVDKELAVDGTMEEMESTTAKLSKKIMFHNLTFAGCDGSTDDF